MEMKQIPDYPGYAATRDGRIYSYKSKKFLSQKKLNWGYRVTLSRDGCRFFKLVHRLVFETFIGYPAECIIHRDRDIYNNSVDNLIGISIRQKNLLDSQRVKNNKSGKTIYKVDVKTGNKEIFEIPTMESNKYSGVYHCLGDNHHSITYKGALYYYDGEKHRLINEIKARIKSNELTLLGLDSYNPFRKTISRHIQKNKKYLEILEKV